MTYNVTLVSSVQQSDPVICIQRIIIRFFFSHSLSQNIEQFSCAAQRFLLVIHLMYYCLVAKSCLTLQRYGL